MDIYEIKGATSSSSSEKVSFEYIPPIAGSPKSFIVEVTEQITLKGLMDCVAEELNVSYKAGEDKDAPIVMQFGDFETTGQAGWTLLVNGQARNSLESLVVPGDRVTLYYGPTNTSSTYQEPQKQDGDSEEPFGFNRR